MFFTVVQNFNYEIDKRAHVCSKRKRMVITMFDYALDFIFTVTDEFCVCVSLTKVSTI